RTFVAPSWWGSLSPTSPSFKSHPLHSRCRVARHLFTAMELYGSLVQLARPCTNIENRCFSRQRILAYWRQNTSPPRFDRTRRFKRNLVCRRGWDLNRVCGCQHTFSPSTPNRPLYSLSTQTLH